MRGARGAAGGSAGSGVRAGGEAAASGGADIQTARPDAQISEGGPVFVGTGARRGIRRRGTRAVVIRIPNPGMPATTGAQALPAAVPV